MTNMSREHLRKGSMVAAAVLALGVPTAALAAGKDYIVPMANMAFGPMPSGLKVGDSITFVNKDSVPHTVTARDHSFDLRIGPGQHGRVNLTKAGTFQIYCILHAPMRASFSVTA